MNTTKILQTEIDEVSVASLPPRPTSPILRGGLGYTSVDMRAAFDRLPLLIIERLNTLISDIESGSIAEVISTGIDEEHTLNTLFSDIKNGNLASYLDVGGKSLATALAELREAVGLNKEESEVE